MDVNAGVPFVDTVHAQHIYPPMKHFSRSLHNETVPGALSMFDGLRSGPSS